MPADFAVCAHGGNRIISESRGQSLSLTRRRFWPLSQSVMEPNRRHRALPHRSEEHTSELQSLMRSSYAVFCLNKKIPTLRHICDTDQQQILKRIHHHES